MASIGKFDMVDGMRHVTLTIRIKREREMKLRLWIGKTLFRLAAFVMNCNIKIEDATESTGDAKP